MHKVSSPMLSPCHCPGSCPVLTLWGTNPKLPGPSRPLSPTKSRFTQLLVLNLVSPQDPDKTALWNHSDVEESTGFPPRRSYVSLTSACSLPGQPAFLGPPNFLRARRGRQVALPEPRARSRCGRPGKVREWESQERGGEEIGQCNCGVRRANSGCVDRTMQLLPPLPQCDALVAPGVSVPCASVPCARVPGLQPRPRPAAASTPTGNFP